MVAVKNYEAEKFLAKRPAHVFLYLVFGTDAGLVSERAKAIVKSSIDDFKDPFQLLRLQGDELAADPLRLADEANTIPLFGGKRAIWIESGARAFVASVEALVKTPPKDCTIVIEAGALKKDSALRKICERDKNAAALECYPDNERDVLALIDSECKAANLTIKKDARAALASLLGQDRLTTRSELAKLVLFSQGNGEIDLAAIDAIISDASGLFLDNAVKAAFTGDFAAIEPITRRFFGEHGDANMLLATALRTAITLQRGMAEAGDAAKEPQVRSNFQARPPLAMNMDGWNTVKLLPIIEGLAAAIKEVRLEPKLGEPLAMRALWSIALTARKENFRTKTAGSQ